MKEGSRRPGPSRVESFTSHRNPRPRTSESMNCIICTMAERNAPRQRHLELRNLLLTFANVLIILPSGHVFAKSLFRVYCSPGLLRYIALAELVRCLRRVIAAVSKLKATVVYAATCGRVSDLGGVRSCPCRSMRDVLPDYSGLLFWLALSRAPKRLLSAQQGLESACTDVFGGGRQGVVLSHRYLTGVHIPQNCACWRTQSRFAKDSRWRATIEFCFSCSKGGV